MLLRVSQFLPTENPLSCFLASALFSLRATEWEQLLCMPSVMLCAQQMSPTLLRVTTHHQQLWARHCTSKRRINYYWSFWYQCFPQFIHSNLMFSLEKEVTKKIRTSVWWKSHLARFRWAIWLLDIMPVLTGLVCYTGSFNNSFFISCIQWLMIFVQEKLLLGLQNSFTVLCSSTLKTQCEPLYLKDTELEK